MKLETPIRTGVDLIEVARIQATIARHGDRFLLRVFTARELACYHDRVSSLAARWAAKEAVAKALGSGIGAVGWRDIEVLNDEQGAPQLHLYGAARAHADRLHLHDWAISLAHTHEHAIAFVVAH